MAFGPSLLMALSLGFLIFGIGMLRIQRPDAGNDDWRDRPPILFRLSRPIVNLFSHRVASSLKPYQLEVTQDKLNSAGMGYTIRPEEYVVTRRVGLGTGITLFVYFYTNITFDSIWYVVILALIIPASYFYPDIWLRDKIKYRHSRFEKDFPFLLDLLVLSMRAGLNFSSALSHSVSKVPSGPVKEEFVRLLRDTRTGISRHEALLNLGKRVNLPPVSNFVAAINQAEETGGELSETLMTQAAQRRSERFLKAEKLANQAPVKMLAPLIGLLFPIVFVVIMFPIFVKARDTGALDFFLR
jgi:tight adherence protein C